MVHDLRHEPGHAQELIGNGTGIGDLRRHVIGDERMRRVLRPVILRDGDRYLVRLVLCDAGRDALYFSSRQGRPASAFVCPDQGREYLLAVHAYPTHGPAESRKGGVPLAGWYGVATLSGIVALWRPVRGREPLGRLR